MNNFEHFQMGSSGEEGEKRPMAVRTRSEEGERDLWEEIPRQDWQRVLGSAQFRENQGEIRHGSDSEPSS